MLAKINWDKCLLQVRCYISVGNDFYLRQLALQTNNGHGESRKTGSSNPPKSYVRLVKGTNFPAPLSSPGGRTARKMLNVSALALNVAHRYVEIIVANVPPTLLPGWFAVIKQQPA